MTQQWREWDDQCDACGSDAEVLTDSGEDCRAYDSDAVRCTECDCMGSVRVEEDGDTWTNWSL